MPLPYEVPEGVFFPLKQNPCRAFGRDVLSSQTRHGRHRASRLHSRQPGAERDHVAEMGQRFASGRWTVSGEELPYLLADVNLGNAKFSPTLIAQSILFRVLTFEFVFVFGPGVTVDNNLLLRDSPLPVRMTLNELVSPLFRSEMAVPACTKAMAWPSIL